MIIISAMKVWKIITWILMKMLVTNLDMLVDKSIFFIQIINTFAARLLLSIIYIMKFEVTCN